MIVPKISVIVPIYNVEKYLSRCIESLINQTLKEIEIILVDDGSKDNSSKICDEYATKDKRIKVIHKKNEGLGLTRNAGIKLATGRYLAFVDSDDYIELDMYEKMYDIAMSNDCDFVRGDAYKELPTGKMLNDNLTSPLKEGIYNRSEMFKNILYPLFGKLPEEKANKYISCSACKSIYKREIINKNNIFFESERKYISEDLLFNLDFIVNSNSAYVINKRFYHYIKNENSLTNSYKKDSFEKEIILYNELKKRLIKYNIYDKCSLRLDRFLIDRTKMCIKKEILGNPNKKEINVNLNKIVTKKEIVQILHEYPIYKLPFKYKVFYLILKYKINILLRLLVFKL